MCRRGTRTGLSNDPIGGLGTIFEQNYKHWCLQSVPIVYFFNPLALYRITLSEGTYFQAVYSVKAATSFPFRSTHISTSPASFILNNALSFSSLHTSRWQLFFWFENLCPLYRSFSHLRAFPALDLPLHFNFLSGLLHLSWQGGSCYISFPKQDNCLHRAIISLNERTSRRKKRLLQPFPRLTKSKTDDEQ